VAEGPFGGRTLLNLLDLYSPFTGKGYNPRVDGLPWKGVIQKLKLKEEHGRNG
jgi:hypothetical protein